MRGLGTPVVCVAASPPPQLTAGVIDDADADDGPKLLKLAPQLALVDIVRKPRHKQRAVRVALRQGRGCGGAGLGREGERRGIPAAGVGVGERGRPRYQQHVESMQHEKVGGAALSVDIRKLCAST
eukprot:359589-Chlamydomonas_euryale.AAC.6